jgi:hypothetical protein
VLSQGLAALAIPPWPVLVQQLDVKRLAGRDARLRVHSLSEPSSEVAMQNSMNGVMSGNGLWTVIGVLLAIFLIVAIVKMLQKK